jgi:hypothetical protein
MRNLKHIMAVIALLGCGDFNSRLDGEILDETGGTVRSEQAELTLPAGALQAPILAQITALDGTTLPDFARVIMQPHRLDPQDVVLDAVGELRLTYDPVALRDVDPANLRLVRVEAEGVMRLAGSVVDVDAATVTAAVDRLGTYGIAPLCSDDAGCDEGERCARGACLSDEACIVDADCRPDELCADNVCQAFAPPDRDADGVPDDADNCPDVPNGEQADADEDGIGDACDPQPGPEVCDDGLDNDADGVVDENCEEICDGLDNDGDGVVDEMCDEPQPEICDGLDNDRDGMTDEDCVQEEICDDAIDNDGDGLVDEGCDGCAGDMDCAPGQTCQDGVCQG